MFLGRGQSRHGEDRSGLFPLRRDVTETLPVLLPDGRTSSRTELLELTMLWGKVVRIVPPDDVAGRQQNGIHTVKLPDGRYFKVTYRGGVPDGPFTAYYSDGALWGEATYVRGRVVGPSWLYTRDGRKFDEFAEPDTVDEKLAAAARDAASASALAGAGGGAGYGHSAHASVVFTIERPSLGAASAASSSMWRIPSRPSTGGPSMHPIARNDSSELS